MMYVYTYTYSQRLSPRLLWVPKFDFKSVCSGHEFQNYPIIATFLKFDVKSMLFFFQFKHYFRLFWILFSKVCFSKTPNYGDKKKVEKLLFSKFPYNGDFSEYCCQKCLFQKHPTMVTKKIQKNRIPLRLSFPLFLLPDCRWHQI